MSVATVAAVQPRVRPRAVAPGRLVIARHAARDSLKWAMLWGAFFGVFVISTVQAFVRGYPTLAQRTELAHSMQAFVVLLGVGHHLETAAGFTSWRLMTVTAFIGAIWALRTSGGLLRGEEDAGRWELILAGPTTARHATLEVLVGLYVALLAMLACVVPGVLLAGQLPGARFSLDLALLYAVSIVAVPAMFLAIGALASQVAANASQAGMLSSVVLVAAYVVRLVADANNGLGWLRWASPLGWMEELSPLRDPDLIALLPVGVLTVTCCALTVVLAGRRDLNASVLRAGESSAGSTRLLSGPTGLAVRLSVTPALLWAAAAAGEAVLLGSVTRTASGVLTTGSPAVAATLGRLGIRQAVQGYLGLIFLMVSVVIALAAASQLASLRDEEASGRLDNLLVRPVSRVTWLAGRLGVVTGLVVLLGLLAGGFAWLGSANQHTGVSPLTMVLAGLNAVPPAIFVIGVGALMFGVRPQLTAAVGYGVVAYSFLMDLLGALIRNADWLTGSSLFTHIALSPAVRPDWGADAIMSSIGIAAAVLGVLAFQRRDIAYG